MRISDWSSVVCSSDLPAVGERAALDRRAAVIGDEAAAIDAATNVLALQRVRKEAEVDVDQIGGAAIDGNVIAGLPRPRRRDLRLEIAGDEGGAGADLHGAEIAAEEIACVEVGTARRRGAAFGPFGLFRGEIGRA